MKIFAVALFFCLVVACQQQKIIEKPNIILVYVDDLGYGDVGCYGAKAVHTPNIDRLASEGLQFTDAHCTAATCTPSRFSLLTGSYAFRNNAAILPGDAPLLIRPGIPTLPGMLKAAGYQTAVIGKWHLGLGNGSVDWNAEIKPGPLEIGFDYSFLIPATLDRVPCVYVENRRVVNLDPKDPIRVDYKNDLKYYPNGLEEPELLKFKGDTQHSNTIIDSVSRIGFMSGGKNALWKDEDMADVFIDKVKSFIGTRRNNPFFLYFSFTDIHVPRVPNQRFVGKSTMGARGDVIAQMDWTVGELMKCLESNGLTKNTMIIFTSDNGPVLDDGYDDRAEALVGDHLPGGPYSGGKYSAYEAGTRVPTIVWWPKIVKAGRTDALVSQVDLFASLATLVDQKLEENAAPDSFDMLPVFLGASNEGRGSMIEESFTLSLRAGNWKYIAPQTQPTPGWLANKTIAVGLKNSPQLYNLKDDITEQNDLSKTDPVKLKELEILFKSIEAKPSRPGFQNRTGDK